MKTRTSPSPKPFILPSAVPSLALATAVGLAFAAVPCFPSLGASPEETTGKGGEQQAENAKKSSSAEANSVAPDKGKAPDSLPAERTKWTRLQLFLDKAGFNPGKIDGRWGEFTRKALVRYLKANGKSEESRKLGEAEPDSIPVDLDSVTQPFRSYQITEEDQSAVGKLAKKPAEKAKQDSLPYTSLLELVAERFHVDKDYLRELNPDRKPKKLAPGDSLTVPNVSEPFDLSRVKSGKPGESSSLKNPRIEIDTAEKQLDLLDGESLVATYPLSPGSKQLPAPKGKWKITSITYMPTFRWDKKMLEEGERSDDAHLLPPGPNSPVGIVWMAINSKGIGIHGTSQPDRIGRATSHGCLRLSNWDAWDLSRRVSSGVEVVIR